jgi:hypothetical protein
MKKKMKMGGSLKPVDKGKNPGLAKLPTPVRNKMGYKKYGGAVDMMQDGGPVFKGSPKSDRKVLKKVKKLTKKFGTDPVAKNPAFETELAKQKPKMQAGGVVKSQPKRVGPVDPDGAYTKVQERNLPPVNAKTKVSLAPDKELGATKMMKKGGEVEKAKGGKWIQKAIKKPGALRAQLGAKKGEPIPAGKLAAAAKKGGKLGQRARLAQTLKKMKKK